MTGSSPTIVKCSILPLGGVDNWLLLLEPVLPLEFQMVPWPIRLRLPVISSFLKHSLFPDVLVMHGLMGSTLI
jgi:hypothetical protein